jgi:hypothetical protein
MERENGVCVQKNKEILTTDEAQTANCLPPVIAKCFGTEQKQADPADCRMPKTGKSALPIRL